MITFNNIVERFEIFAENHFFIKTFSFGSPDDVDLSKFTSFPLMHLVYTGATYDAGTKTYNLEVYILDAPADKDGKTIRQKEVVSDAEQCAEDIIADIKNGGNIFLFAQDYEVVNATTTPLEEETKNVLSGVLLDLSVAIPYEWDACNAPIDGVTPEGGDEISYARRGILRMVTQNGATDVLSVRTIKVSNGTLTDEGDGVVSLDTAGAESLNELTDVTITSLTPSQFLQYNGISGFWENETLYLATLADTKGTPTEGQLLKRTGGFWQPADIGLNDLAGVTITSPITGNVLKYDSNLGWYNTNIPAPSPPPSTTDQLPEGTTNLYYTEARVSANADVTANTAKVGITAQQAADILNNNAKVSLIAGGTTGQALVKTSGTDYDVEWADIAVDVQYHNRYATESETLRAGATATTELYYSAQADGDGLAESASSDTPAAGYDIRRKLYYSEAGFADPDTGTWTQFTAIGDNTTFNNAKAALLAYLKERTGGTVPISLKMTWEEVAQAPSFTGLLNESYGSGAEAAYSTRRLNGNYSGDCMTIRRASDGTTTSIGFVGEEIDESAIETFCTGTTCTVATWYDQSGNGNHATQTTPANQPTIYTGGQLVKEGGRLAVDFTSNNYMQSPANVLGTVTEATQIHLSAFKLTGTSNQILSAVSDGGYGGSNDWMAIRQQSGFNQFTVSGNNINNGTATTNTALFFAGIDFSAGTVNFSVDGSNVTGSITQGSRSFTDEVDISFIDSNGSPLLKTQQIAQEIIFYSSDKSSVRTDIEGNISAYFQSAKLLDEQYGEGAEAAYSTRQLRRDQTECMVIRRASDSTTQTIGFDGSGNIDEAAITTFCTGTTCTVVTWKDQSGNGNDATQSDPTKQPTIYTGGALVKQDGRLALSYDSNDLLQASITISHVPLSAFLIQSGPATQADTPFDLGTTASTVEYTRLQSNAGSTKFQQLVVRSVADGIAAANASDDFNRSLITLIARAVNNRSIYVDSGTAVNLTTSVTTVDSTFLKLGGNPTEEIKQSEVILYASDKDTAGYRTSIESNIGDYFTQNTPLLDTYSGAAAAYSLRLLDSTYTGSAVEVYNGSSYADIGFNVFGELDTVALAAHCGSNDGFVSKWYDQSGNSNDAAQTTTADMPKIYDGTTGVVTDPDTNKPSLNADGTDFMLNTSFTPTFTNFTVAAVTHDVVDATNTRRGLWSVLDGTNLATLNIVNNYIVSTGNEDRVRINATNADYTHTVGSTVLKFQEYDGSDVTVYEDGTQKATANVGAFTATPQTLTIMTGFSFDYRLDGYLSEFIIYNSDQSANRTNIEDNINTFYSIY